MAEPATAKTGTPATDTVEILWTSGSGYSPDPQASNIPAGGTLTIISNYACWVWTIVGDALVNAFENETGHYLDCSKTGSNVFTTIEAAGTVITIVPLAVNSNPPPTSVPIDSLRGTVKVGSGEGEHHRR
jgi:hypothetical protein